MFRDSPFDPERAASFLIALAEALRSDPSSFDAAGSLGAELLNASNAARAWAAERGLPVACFPTAPAPHELTIERATGFLVDLAEVLLFAGARALALALALDDGREL
jgi:hypothetical protein